MLVAFHFGLLALRLPLPWRRARGDRRVGNRGHVPFRLGGLVGGVAAERLPGPGRGGHGGALPPLVPLCRLSWHPLGLRAMGHAPRGASGAPR